MKKTVFLMIFMLVIFISAASADDIWEPPPDTISAVTIPDLFHWGDDMRGVRTFLRKYEDYGAEIEESEDGFCKIISLSDRNRNEDFTCSFMFTKDTEKLWQVRTSTVYIDGDSASDVLETVFSYYDMYSMESYNEPLLAGRAESAFQGYLITADADTIYCGGYDNYEFSRSGQRMFFALIDRAYYESLLPEERFGNVRAVPAE